VDHFSLEDALDEGFFSDLDVRSLDGQSFHVHRTVLACCCPGMRYRDWEVFLSQIKSTLVSAVLRCVCVWVGGCVGVWVCGCVCWVWVCGCVCGCFCVCVCMHV